LDNLINIGFGNMINTGKVVAVISPDSAPVKRLVQYAKDDGRAIDATQGRRTRAVVITDDDHVVLSALLPETIAGRFNGIGITKHTADMDKGEDYD
jgi:regulator of extracellular matrix RemA (YlzA/DUF370 family)